MIQGFYPPASTWKLATSVIALENGVVRPDDRMPVPCSGGFWYGRYFRCWERTGHGNVNLQQAIEKSCDVFFYQLGLKIGLTRLLAGGVHLGFDKRSGIDLPNEQRSRFPQSVQYYNDRYGPRGWTNAVVLNLSIGQGENSQTVANMAKFYTALATDGHAAKPEIVKRNPERERVFALPDAQMRLLRTAMSNVTTARGTAASAAIEGVVFAGKTGTAQNHVDATRDHAWFVGFAPADDPKIVVSVFVEFGEHGYVAARVASRIAARFLKGAPTDSAAAPRTPVAAAPARAAVVASAGGGPE